MLTECESLWESHQTPLGNAFIRADQRNQAICFGFRSNESTRLTCRPFPRVEEGLLKSVEARNPETYGTNSNVAGPDE